MSHQYFMKTAIIASLFVTLSACQRPLSPEQLADTFWQAALKNDVAALRQLSSDSSIGKAEDFSALADVTAYSVGTIVIDGDEARAETAITLKSSGNELDLKTCMQKIEQKWLVDYQCTVAYLSIDQEMNDLVNDIEDLADEIGKQVEGTVEEFRQKAMPKIKSQLERAEQELKKKLPEVREKFEQFLEELERSIEESMPAEEPETTRT